MLPRTAYILLWFPKPSETFVFREALNLQAHGLPLKVFTLYGELKESLSPEMAGAGLGVERLGVPYLPVFPQDVAYWRRRNPSLVRWLFRTIPWRRWKSLEAGGENLWAFLCAFRLARRFEEERIELIHAPWANGPATAAWVASKLTGIPFGFTGRATDIYPPDGALSEKMRDSAFVRTNTRGNVKHLTGFADGRPDKIHLVYNCLTLERHSDAPAPMIPPYKILALGRFAPKKGYDVLLRSVHMLWKSGMDLRLTLGGAGHQFCHLRSLVRQFGLETMVSFPGFVPHHQVSGLFTAADIFVMPSLIPKTGDRDGIPNVIMEALLHRVPVVATDVSAIGEVIVHGETGVLAPPGDAEGLAQAIRDVVTDREGALRMAAAGRDRVLKQFDPDQNTRLLLELYADAVRQYRAVF